MGVILELSWVVPAFLRGPLFLIVLQISFEFTVVLADDSLGGVVESISDIVGAFWYVFGPVNVVANKRLSIRSQPFQLFSVEATVLYRAVVPVLVLKLQIVVEKVLSLDELSAIPFGNVSALLKQL